MTIVNLGFCLESSSGDLSHVDFVRGRVWFQGNSDLRFAISFVLVLRWFCHEAALSKGVPSRSLFSPWYLRAGFVGGRFTFQGSFDCSVLCFGNPPPPFFFYLLWWFCLRVFYFTGFVMVVCLVMLV